MTTATRSMDMFMKGKAKQAVTEEVIVSKRYVDEDGNTIPFVLKAVDTKRIEDLQDECTVPQFKKGKKVGEEIDWKRFACRLAVETTVFPNFRDAELLSSYGLVDPCDLVKEILNVGGEYAELIQAVQRVNGFDTDFEELVEEAKN
ncbi:phage portal protein [Paenibacillus sp. NEAU-GSW1]|uniref:phage tail assembly chaperone n=1 Tax=Paenibacillus sp. NEAU-GSW1 TaxID=2682486 RepID=UPI0012E2BD2B|nr:phage portal protein [Paenibacillus sp. NEAU-GSW1]MUT65316.1 phage portal protein [Paenibacillus sp. NEAU-GSW1]